MAATRRLFNYPGTKRYLTGMVSAICAKAHRERVWVEPFCGSAALFYGLAARPERALLNDADPHVMLMHQACRDFGYGEYAKAVSYVDGRFGDVTADKAAYYSFRKWWNEEGSGLPEAGLLLIYLSSMCINSMLRFGPNGMNQGWGKRRSVIGEGDWEEMRARLQSAELTSGDYRLVSVPEGSVVFLDPPYEAADNSLYGHGFSQREFLGWLSAKRKACPGCLWIYTDVETEAADSLLDEGFRKVRLRGMVTTAPSKAKSGPSATEAMYVAKS